jgi:hypothetical protein
MLSCVPIGKTIECFDLECFADEAGLRTIFLISAMAGSYLLAKKSPAGQWSQVAAEGFLNDRRNAILELADRLLLNLKHIPVRLIAALNARSLK